MDKARDHCGIFGVFNHPDAARLTYFGLHALQHRGQESAGIVTSVHDEATGRKTMPIVKDFGLVLDVFDDESVFSDTLLGDSAIGHTRYSTSGSATNPANIQPFVALDREGHFALAHNGNLSNARAIRERLVERGTLFRSSSDTELILHLAAQSTAEGPVARIVDALHECEGAFSLVIQTDEALIAARDPSGFRPLALGQMPPAPGRTEPGWVVASETCAFDIVGATYVRDIEPGEILVIDREGVERVGTGGDFNGVCLPRPHGVSQCVFEYVYFSRPDSRVFGATVDKVRRKMGKRLAHDAPVPKVAKGQKRPIVMAVPDSSNTAAIGYVSESNKQGRKCKLDIGLIRNHYVGRTFIAPGQSTREQRVRTKFNPVAGVLKDRVVVMVDDSIVRGTTAQQLVQMVRDAGAAEVHFRSASPPVRWPCFYGMDFPSREELAANKHGSVQAIADWLGVDSLGYLTVEGMLAAVEEAHESRERYCSACFSGEYPVPVETGVVKEENDW
ncbi:amidophosphoribosyltransferase [Rubrivirga sp. IMCC45206]|uniref:amidophosphoribosyltransferase n=1 Tax=Rubrivirga sp. IMCC45206 TaxID=3391614 RepID=UPI0039903428